MISVKNNSTYVVSIAGKQIIPPLGVAEVDDMNRGVAALIAEGVLVPVDDGKAAAAQIQAEIAAREEADRLAAQAQADAEQAEADARVAAEEDAARAAEAQADADAQAKADADAATAAEGNAPDKAADAPDSKPKATGKRTGKGA